MIKGIKLSLPKRRIYNSRNSSSGNFKTPITSAVVLLDSTNINALQVLGKLKQELKLKDSGFKMILFKRKEENFPDFNGLTFVDEDLNFLGNFNKAELLDFTKNHIDLLITFAEGNNVLINLLTATFNADLKVGNDPKCENILDVVIRSGKEVEVFTSELIKLLKQFKNNSNE
ncbi:hypothetical protein BC962_2537 [Gillisia mitskevichiae]|uniref:Uncharacterized protein n=1 Tax=Gillisia mitskevichiae TaxID=270921 RepID=A0A495PJE8_9FLAO|nr:hypothetical protein [Gillisia mitskevichiae]RKS50763.1 hypothetical protein BC962_2537 [Gillisia mitskevichiae]